MGGGSDGVIVQEQIGTRHGRAIMPPAEDYFVFVRSLNIVIPGRRAATSPNP
jgi:hypothetical protein